MVLYTCTYILCRTNLDETLERWGGRETSDSGEGEGEGVEGDFEEKQPSVASFCSSNLKTASGVYSMYVYV